MMSAAANINSSLDVTTTQSLSAFARRRRLLLIARAIASGLIVLCLGLLLIAVCDHLWWLPDTVRWSLSLLVYLAAAGCVWLAGFRQLPSTDLRMLARQFEAVEPKLHEQLLSAVELADPELTNGSASFRDRLQRRVSQRIGSLDVKALLPFALVRRTLWIAAAIVFVGAALSVVPAWQFGRRIARAALPGLPIERASLTSIEILAPQPPSQTVAQGDSLGIVVALRGRPAESVWLRWQAEGGPISVAEMMPRQQAAGADSIDSSATVFAANLPVGQDPLRYQVRAGDGETLWYSLYPTPRPAVQEFAVTYRYPDYAKLPERHEVREHGDLDAFVGTIADVTVTFDQPVSDAVIRFSGIAAELAMTAVGETGHQFQASIPIKTPGSYQVDAVSRASGINNPFSPQYSITPVVDAPPTVHWDDSMAESTLVSPLEAVNLRVAAQDDMPLDGVTQEYRVNHGGWKRRRLPFQTPSTDVTIDFSTDLMHLDGNPDNETQLDGGDVVETRIVVVDRAGKRAQSSSLQFLVVNEGFDSSRHDRLRQRRALVELLTEWLSATEQLSESLVAHAGLELNASDESLTRWRQSIQENHATIERLTALSSVIDTHYDELLKTAETPWEADQLESLGRAQAELAEQVALLTGALDRLVVRDEQPDADTLMLAGKALNNARRELRQQSHAAAELAKQAQRLARAHFAQDLTKSLFVDALSVAQGLAPFLREDSTIPIARFDRYVNLVVGRLQDINSLVVESADELPDSTRRQLDNWLRFSDSWQDRLRELTQRSAEIDRRRAGLQQFDADLRQQTRQVFHDGRLPGLHVDAARELPQLIGPFADKLLQVRALGDELNRLRAEAAAFEDSDRQRHLSQHAVWLESLVTDRVAALSRRISGDEDRHRDRPAVDLAYAADLSLLERALSNVAGQGYAAYQDDSAHQVFTNLATAMMNLEAAHEARLLLRELQSIVHGERYVRDPAAATFDRPTALEQYQASLQSVIQRLRSAGVPDELVNSIDQTRSNAGYNEARSRMTSRRWSNDPIVAADDLLANNERQFTAALEQLEPLLFEARELIRRYVLSLPEQARRAAEEATAVRDQIRARDDDAADTASQLAERQHSAAAATRETLDSLVDFANNADPLDRRALELARDADVAANQIRSSLEEAERAMQRALLRPDPKSRGPELDRVGEALDQLSSTLQQTAEHFENAAAGTDLNASRQALEMPMQDPNADSSADERLEASQANADRALSDPQELLARLEEELQRNEPMQTELSELAEQATKEALHTLQQAGRDERAMHQRFEQADGVFGERKSRYRQQLHDLAVQARGVEEGLFGQAERAAAWGSEPPGPGKIKQARETLSEAIRQVDQLNDQALLSELQSASVAFDNALEQAAELSDEIQQESSSQLDEDVTNNADHRRVAMAEMARIAQDARRLRSRSANQRRTEWSREKSRANQRVQAANRRQRQATQRKAQLAKQLRNQPADERLIREQQLAETQIELEDQIASAARQTVKLASEREQAAAKQSRQWATESIPALQATNPAAETVERLSTLASERMAQLRELAAALANEGVTAADLSVPPAQATGFPNAQQQISRGVADASDKLARAARHEGRLGNTASAEQLDQAAQSIVDSALAPTIEAQRKLTDAVTEPRQSVAASQAVANATAQLFRQAEQLEKMLAQAAQPASSPDAAGEPDATSEPGSTAESSGAPTDPSTAEQDGQRLARTLDELDRSLNASSSAQSAVQESGTTSAASNSSAAPANASADAGQPPGAQADTPDTAMEASPTLASAVDDQSQQSARQRQQQLDADNDPNQLGSDTSQSGPGEAIDDQPLDYGSMERIGADWGQLRRQRTEDVAEERQPQITPGYRREVEAYFRAVARQAAAREGESK